ncbi:MAG: hypothetical protein ACQESH_07705 [Campylobacterota bacterium]
MKNKIVTKLDKTQLESVLVDIIDRFYNDLVKDDRVNSYIDNPQALLILKHKQTLLAYRFFTLANNTLDKHISYAAKAHEKIGLSSDILYEYSLKMVVLYEQWLINHKKVSQEELLLWKEKLSEFLTLMMEDYGDKKSEDEMFLDIDEGVRNSQIDNMHYDEAQKVDAQSFMALGLIHTDEIDELKDMLIDLSEHIEDLESFDNELLHEFAMVLSKISKFFVLSGEFKDLSYPVDNLNHLLSTLEFETVDADTKDMLFNFLKSINDDLNKWIQEVFINKSARDIHYLDASLLANISQIEIMIADSDDDEDDDDFLF